MKKTTIFLLILLCASSLYSASNKWGRMNRLHISTYAVDDYSEYRKAFDSKAEDLISIRHKNAFVENMIESVKKKYPTINTAVPYDRENKDATNYNFRNDFLSKSDVVFFAGHGNQQSLTFYDKTLKSSQRPLGGDVRWAFFDACLYLNVNKKAFLDKPLTTESIDFSKVDELRKIFNGVHAVLGHYALGKQVYVVKNGVRTETATSYKSFSKYFVEKGYTIWDAYRNTIKEMYENVREFDQAGLMPAIAFLRGYDKNGEYHDTSTETFERVYKAPLKPEDGLELFVMYEKYGKPIFK